MKREFDILVVSYNGGCTGRNYEKVNCTTSMYGAESEFGRVKIGGKIVDLRDVGNIVPAVFMAPLLDLGLKDDEIKPFSKDLLDSSFFAKAVKSQPNNAFGAILRVEDACQEQGFSSLDSVGMNVYLDYWKNNGARIGTVMETDIVWE